MIILAIGIIITILIAIIFISVENVNKFEQVQKSQPQITKEESTTCK